MTGAERELPPKEGIDLHAMMKVPHTLLLLTITRVYDNVNACKHTHHTDPLHASNFSSYRLKDANKHV